MFMPYNGKFIISLTATKSKAKALVLLQLQMYIHYFIGGTYSHGQLKESDTGSNYAVCVRIFFVTVEMIFSVCPFCEQ